MAGVGEQVAGRAVFDDAPGVHDPDALAHAGDHAEVVADQQDGRVDARAQLVDQVEHLGLDRGIEAGRRLVEHEQARVAAQGHGDHHALLLAAGELKRVTTQRVAGVGHGDALEGAAGALERVLAGHAEVGAEDLGDLVAHPDRRVQRRRRILVDHAQLGAAHLAQAVVGHRQHVLAVEDDRARVDPPVAGQVAHERERGRRLAAARLADQAVGLRRRRSRRRRA